MTVVRTVPRGRPGRGIVTIVRTSGDGSAGSLDTYTVTYTDQTTSTFTVRNGTDGVDGTDAGVAEYVDPASGTFAEDLVEALIAAGLMAAPTPPTFTSITPNTMPENPSGSTEVFTIIGTNLDQVYAVGVEGGSVVLATHISDTEITASLTNTWEIANSPYDIVFREQGQFGPGPILLTVPDAITAVSP